jgi:hypothetical protein
MNPIPQLDPIAKPKDKFTLLVTGGGMMGVDVRKAVVSRGWLGTQRGETLCYSAPRAKKIYGFLPILQNGAIVLKGHEESRPVFESHARAVGGFHSFVMDGKGGRFIDYNEEGTDALIAYLKKHLVLHTLNESHSLTLLCEAKDSTYGQRSIADPDFKRKLLEALGPAVELAPPAPVVPERKSLLTPKMKLQLQEAEQKGSPTHPLFKIFSPEGSATWLLCGMEADEDTLWAVCDLGKGIMEYGTVSLRELETARGPRFKLPMERDLLFDGKQWPIKDLLDKTSLTA